MEKIDRERWKYNNTISLDKIDEIVEWINEHEETLKEEPDKVLLSHYYNYNNLRTMNTKMTVQ